ncbi:Na+/H+ antiporter subunit E [Abyssicoccus albus]|uniref:Multisubunit sodium/proton antiporter MrpE subunit n=1 Tax=Abyssicoccus albus TaxID=1817405 RepID=A0A3N5CC75_9BACL|nr:Na+/H+ antiporter subunit E [Abyssicoccus albus]RPF57572.1 multisubunit sodium/proton antiporter MrpE subunit [Abyssicoccus albus]
MAIQILINVLLALLWMFINNSFQVSSFLFGYILGLFTVYIMRKFLPEEFYLKRVIKILKLVYVFAVELFKANLSVLKIVMKPQIDIEPAFFAYPTELEKDWQITLLSSLITLTPGTVVVAVSHDQRTLYVHAIDTKDVDESIHGIKRSFEKMIKEVSER